MKDNFIRTIYLYLFALVGLAVLVIGTGQLVDLGLKVFVFKYADVNNNYGYDYGRPVSMAFDQELSKVENLSECGTDCNLTDSQLEQIDNWLIDYKTWQESQKDVEKIDYQRQSRERQASRAISLILVGLPLYMYHWTVIKRDRKRKA
ncbi:hypothetical protein ISR92_00765 [Patescibacteria group bacterium]|nr:hypothetical protein [Patescibacteria group bacterium]